MEVWKYDITEPDSALSMPVGAETLHVAEQRGRWCLWVRVDPTQRAEEVRRFRVVGTGHSHAEGEYVGTLLMDGGALVFHVFETHLAQRPAPLS
jgi:hypothetical protein